MAFETIDKDGDCVDNIVVDVSIHDCGEFTALRDYQMQIGDQVATGMLLSTRYYQVFVSNEGKVYIRNYQAQADIYLYSPVNEIEVLHDNDFKLDGVPFRIDGAANNHMIKSVR
jgi:hypothetical protein